MHLGNHPEITKDNDYLLSRYDGVVIDGRDWDARAYTQLLELKRFEYAGLETSFAVDILDSLSNVTKKKNSNSNNSMDSMQYSDDFRRNKNNSNSNPFLNKFKNPYAIGNYINHPPNGLLPNVMIYAYNFPSNGEDPYYLDSNMSSFIPHERPNQSNLHFYAEGEPMMQSMVVVATRHIENEEILFNYRYNPRVKPPSWYSPVDIKEVERRWNKMKLFGIQWERERYV